MISNQPQPLLGMAQCAALGYGCVRANKAAALGRRVPYRREDLHAWINAQHRQGSTDCP
jgi:hypothetical protein